MKSVVSSLLEPLRYSASNLIGDYEGVFFNAAKNGHIKYAEIPKLEKAFRETNKSMPIRRSQVLDILLKKRNNTQENLNANFGSDEDSILNQPTLARSE